MNEPLIITNIRLYLAENFNKHGANFRVPTEIIVSQEVWNEVDKYYDYYYNDKVKTLRPVFFDNKNEICNYVKGIKLVIGEIKI